MYRHQSTFAGKLFVNFNISNELGEHFLHTQQSFDFQKLKSILYFNVG